MRWGTLASRIIDALPVAVVAGALRAWESLMDDAWRIGSVAPDVKRLLLLGALEEAAVTQLQVAIPAIGVLTLMGIPSARRRRIRRDAAYAQVTIVVACTSFLTLLYLTAYTVCRI